MTAMKVRKCKGLFTFHVELEGGREGRPEFHRSPQRGVVMGKTKLKL